MKNIKYSDADITDKSRIIDETQNVESLKKLLGNNLPISYEENLLEFVPRTLNAPLYNETDKFGILFSPKGGSSIIDSILDEYSLSVLSEFSDKKWASNYFSFLSAQRKESTIYKTWNEFRDICDGTSKKDLIIIIRNPIYKWLSGVWMDINLEVETSKILYSYLKEKYSLDTIIGDNHLSDKAIQDIIFKYLKQSIESGELACNSHGSLYNESFFNLLTNNNISKDKLKIVDIDDGNVDLIDLFQKFYPQIQRSESDKLFWTMRGIHKTIIDGLVSEIAIQNDKLYSSILRNELTRDLYYYTLLKEKYKNSFIL